MISILINLNNHKESFFTIKEDISNIKLKKEETLKLEITFKRNGFVQKIEINKKYNEKIEEKLFYFINNINLKEYRKAYKIIFNEKDIELEIEENNISSNETKILDKKIEWRK